jgi:hypothetical protein
MRGRAGALVCACFLALALCGALPEAEAGTVAGRVVASGVPKEEPLVPTKDQKVCGSRQSASTYRVSSAGGVGNVVVWLEGVSGNRPAPRKETALKYEKCRIEPLVSIGTVGGEFAVESADPILHNAHFFLRLAYHPQVSQRPLEIGATVYNVALPRRKVEVRKPITGYHRFTDETGYLTVRCNLHPWERAYVFVFDHPYAAVTDGEGEFAVPEIPPGTYTLRYWHEGYGEGKQRVEVRDGATTSIGIQLGL